MSSTTAAKIEQRLLPAETVDRARPRAARTGTARTNRRPCRRRTRSTATAGGISLPKAPITIVKDAARESEADHHAGGQMEHPRRVGVGHRRAGRAHRGCAPTLSTGTAPYRSAIAPANGWAAPHSSIWIASASANTSRPQPLVCDIGVRKNAQPRTRPEAEHADQATAHQDDRGRAPRRRVRRRRSAKTSRAKTPCARTAIAHDGRRGVRCPPARGLASFFPALAAQAGAAARRCTGFSTIGRLITAESTPNRTESHQTAS